jgi:predicted component of type VI protein secretion system
LSVIPLIVTVSEPDTGATWDYVFEAGPVVVGRGDGVQLCLDRPFVSLQHGTFDFDDASVTYMDLDSRNGTLVDGATRASDRPVPMAEATELRIGKLRLRVSRVLPPKAVGDDAPSPFAPKPGRGAAKGTDAVPREDLERIRRELVARKEPPPPAAPPAPVPPRPSEPLLDKTVPVPQLQSRPPGVSPPVSATYAAGATQAVPAPARTPAVRRTPREPRPRVARESRPRPVVTPPPRRRGLWLPIAIGVVVASAAAILLLASGGERRARDDGDPPEPTATGGAPVREKRVVRPPVTPEPTVDPPPEKTPKPPRPTPRHPAPEPPGPDTARSGNRSPILP